MRKLIYADNAATTRMSEKACEVMLRYYSSDYANPSQPYSFARNAKKILKEARGIIADCIGAEFDEIFFTSCGTESNNWVIKCSDVNKIISTQIEHHAVLNSCDCMSRYGREVVYLPVDNEGVVITDVLKSEVSENSLTSIMFSNNEIGTIQPIKELAEIVHQRGSLFHTDAVPAVGHVEIDVKDLGVDFLSASAHKFNGPKGVGFLYKKEGVQLSSFIDGGSQEMGSRSGTENVPGIAAMAIALKENIDSLKSNKKHIASLELKLIEMLNAAGIDFKVNGHKLRHIPGIISLSFPDFNGESILHRLDLSGICVSTGSACNNTDTHISHVLKALNLEESYAKGTIRVSLGKDNTEDDINRIGDALIKIITKR